MNDQYIPEGKDPQRWRIAKKRASFKRHLAVYIAVNLFLWLVWFFTGSRNDEAGIPWPAWASVGWGIGLAFNYMGAYISTGIGSVEREYDKLTNHSS
jgi:hypothetical protein